MVGVSSISKPCTKDPGLWFSKEQAGIAAAKALCSTCPFRESCLQDTLDYEDLTGDSRIGIFGGLTSIERIHLRLTRA